MNIVGLIVSYGYVFLVLVASRWLERYGKETSRKFVHILSANWWIIAMVFFDQWVAPFIVGLSFLVVNYLSYKYKIFKSIELEDRDGGYGTIYYAVSVTLLVVLSYLVFEDITVGFVGLLVMGYGDGLAALVGQKFPGKVFKVGGHRKSIGGTLTMFGVSLLITLLGMVIGDQGIRLGSACLVALVATIAELIGGKGVDNLTVPLLSALLYGLLMTA